MQVSWRKIAPRSNNSLTASWPSEDVVYVVITGSDGTVLAQHTKGTRQSSASLVRSVDHPLYPDSQIAKQLFQSSSTTPLMTRLSISTALSNRFAWEEIVYDFAMPVLRTAKGSTSLPPFSIQLDEGSTDSSPTQPALVSGVVQIGLTDARLKDRTRDDDQKYSPPHRPHHRRRRARRPPAHPPHHETAEKPWRCGSDKWLRATRRCPSHPPRRDEVGQLTSMFNLMTHSLQERSLAITANLATIKHQVSQLTTLHQVSAAISRTLDLNQLLNTVLQLLIANLGFTRMLLMLRHRERDTAYVAQIAGVSPDIAGGRSPS